MKNTFSEYGYSDIEIEAKVKSAWDAMFALENKVYFEPDDTTGFLTDTGNNDVRTEGMSYGMMMSVMQDKKDIFDRLWNWVVKYMYMPNGWNAGYFAWSCALDGTKNAWGPAPDGEEFFAMALFLASKKWGDGKNNQNYSKWAKQILTACLHSKTPMWDASNHLIQFVAGCGYSDPSYHLPHFYEYFAENAEPCDKDFWTQAAKASREYIALCSHPVTGMTPEYSYYNGDPNPFGPPEGHGDFYSDAYRTGANIGLDALWNGQTPELSKVADNLVTFFADIDIEDYQKYKINGELTSEKALHPVGLLATLAQTTLACTPAVAQSAEKIVRRFWATPPRTGERRYYDNCLYLFAVLALSGKYKI